MCLIGYFHKNACHEIVQISSILCFLINIKQLVKQDIHAVHTDFRGILRQEQHFLEGIGTA